MIRLIALGFCLLLAGAQDPDEKVRALVEKLKSEDIAEREKAAAEIVKLGPSALKPLREHFEMARGDTRDQLERILRKLEADEKVAHLMRQGPSVTLAVKNRPAGETLAEIRRQSGVLIEGQGLLADSRFDLDVRDASAWKAVDELCRVHGKVMYTFDADRIVVRPGAYRKIPAFDLGPYRFVVDSFDWKESTGDNLRRFDLIGGLLAPPGRFPDSSSVEVEKFEDESGANLMPKFEMVRRYFRGPSQRRGTGAPVIFRCLNWEGGEGPSVHSSKLKSFSGSVHVTFALDRRRILAVKNPQAPGDRSMSEGMTTLRLHDVSRDGSRVLLKCWFQRPLFNEEREGDVLYGRYTLALYDAGGRRLPGLHVDPLVDVHLDEGGGVLRCADTLSFNLPEGFVPESLDLEKATEFHTLRIPFNLDCVSLR
ncbi:MAG TPA: hypothetical protein VFC86_10700 [Planctomycetota bacterium]|nr:hypothetical protein [Planctomycetota bacterium]